MGNKKKNNAHDQQWRARAAQVYSNPVSIGGGVEVEYKRTDSTEVLIQMDKINPVLTKTGTTAVRTSYALFWIVPKLEDSDSRGNLLQLDSTSVELFNDGPVDLYIAGARPYGFATDPAGIAHWESLMGKDANFEIKAGQRRTFNIAHHFNNFVQPRRATVGGKDCVHVMSLSIARARATSAGIMLPEDTTSTDYEGVVALRASFTTTYNADGSQVGSIGAYQLRTYADSRHMEEVNYPPALSLSAAELRTNSGQVLHIEPHVYGSNPVPTGGYVVLFQFRTLKGLENEVDGLDKGMVYSLSSAFACFNGEDFKTASVISGSYLIYHIGGKIQNGGDSITLIQGWHLHFSPERGLGGMARFSPGKDGTKTTLRFTPRLPGTLAFMPTRDTYMPVKVRKMKIKRIGRPLQARMVSTSDQLLLQRNWVDSFLNAASVVVRVLKTAVAIAGFLGLAALDSADFEEVAVTVATC